MSSKLLVVDDDPKIAKIEEHTLLQENFEVDIARSGQEAIHQFKRDEYALVILDLSLPDMDGFQVCKTIREVSSVPIIILSVNAREADKVFGFNLGIDDYLTKPFSPIELSLRVKAILRRAKIQYKQVSNETTILCYEGLSIDPSARQVEINGCPVELTAKEFDILWFLIQHPNKVFTRTQLLYQMWHDDYLGSENTVTVLISRLREKINAKDQCKRTFIQTIRGVGYKFVME